MLVLQHIDGLEFKVVEYRAGDKIRVTDVTEGVVSGVETDSAGRVAIVKLEGRPGSRYNVQGDPVEPRRFTRTIEVIERAPDPWQAGDIIKSATGHFGCRQADGSWLDQYGGVMAWTDESAETNQYIITVVRGGKRVAP